MQCCFTMLLHWKVPRWYVRFRLLIFADPFVGTCVFRLCTVFRLCAAAPVECVRSGCSCAKNFELPTYSQFLMQYRCARFWFSELGETYTFREFNIEDLKPLQQFGIFFIYYGTGFVWIVDFFYILYVFFKKLHLYKIDRTYLLKPIL